MYLFGIYFVCSLAKYTVFPINDYRQEGEEAALSFRTSLQA